MVLEKLEIPGMDGRVSTLASPLEGTYDWILDDTAGSSRLHSFDSSPCPFPAWLKSHGGSFLIVGKAGSGKSTLMKHIINHEKADVLLEQWATSLRCRLIKANFFFYRVGESFESTREGMVQSILYQILSKIPDWIPLVFPSRFSSQTNPLVENSSWTWKNRELFEAMSRLADQVEAESICICLFLDGLDEHKDFHEQEALMDDLANLLRSKHVKICASSRSRDIFMARLGLSGHRIVLERHTRSDLRRFIANELNKSGNFRKWQILDSVGCRNFVEEVEEKADGVFLWVYLAMKQLRAELSTCGNPEDLELADLRDRLRHLPDNLRDYFKTIMDNTDECYRGHMARLLLLMQLNAKPIPTIAAKFLENDLQNPTFTSKLLPLGYDEVLALDRRGKSLARKWCSDLVELQSERSDLRLHSVRFAHRSIADYLDSDECCSLLAKTAKQGLPKKRDFDIYLTLCKIHCANFQVVSRIDLWLSDYNIQLWSDMNLEVLTKFSLHEIRRHATSETVFRNFADACINEAIHRSETMPPSEGLRAPIKDAPMREALTLSLAATNGLKSVLERCHPVSNRRIHPYVLDVLLCRIAMSKRLTGRRADTVAIVDRLLSCFGIDLNNTLEGKRRKQCQAFAALSNCPTDTCQPKHETEPLSIWEIMLDLHARSFEHREKSKLGIERSTLKARDILTIWRLCLASGANVRDCRLPSSFPKLDSLLAHWLRMFASREDEDLDKLRQLLEDHGIDCGDLETAWACGTQQRNKARLCRFCYSRSSR